MMPFDRRCSMVEEVHRVQREMDLKWGFGRLRLLVDHELRSKFDRQRTMFEELMQSDETCVEDIESCGRSLVRGFCALDAEAESLGAERLDPDVWEFDLTDGDGEHVVGCIIKDGRATAKIKKLHKGRRCVVWSLEELRNILSNRVLGGVNAVKEVFPGAQIERIRESKFDWEKGDDLEDIFSAG